jgi:hypothetical protein
VSFAQPQWWRPPARITQKPRTRATRTGLDAHGTRHAQDSTRTGLNAHGLASTAHASACATPSARSRASRGVDPPPTATSIRQHRMPSLCATSNTRPRRESASRNRAKVVRGATGYRVRLGNPQRGADGIGRQCCDIKPWRGSGIARSSSATLRPTREARAIFNERAEAATDHANALIRLDGGHS